jgi:hypothetical protein
MSKLLMTKNVWEKYHIIIRQTWTWSISASFIILQKLICLFSFIAWYHSPCFSGSLWTLAVLNLFNWLVGWYMVFNTTFNNISVILWLSVLLVEETGVPGENNQPIRTTDKLYHIMLYQVYLIWAGFIYIILQQYYYN